MSAVAGRQSLISTQISVFLRHYPGIELFMCLERIKRAIFVRNGCVIISLHLVLSVTFEYTLRTQIKTLVDSKFTVGCWLISSLRIAA